MQETLLDIHAGTIIWTIVTFVVVLIVLKSTVWKPLLAALDEREKRIRDALDSADKARTEAQETLAEHQRRLEQAEDEAIEIIRQARSTAEQSSEEILEKAREDARQTLEQARRAIDAEKRAAIAELRREMGDLAVQVAGELLDANLSDERSRRLVDDMIDRIPQSPAGNN